MKYYTLILSLAVSLSACNYDNTFVGSLNGAPASMTAQSKNIARYCIALAITAGSETKSSFISAQSVFDENDFLKPMSFNTKGAPCGANLDEYLVGSRSTTVLQRSLETHLEVTGSQCQYITYNKYKYKEDISFEMKKNDTDVTTDVFNGVGEESEYTDFDHPVNVGPIYYCGPSYPSPYPHGYPHPRPVPRPFPHVGLSVGVGFGIGHR